MRVEHGSGYANRRRPSFRWNVARKAAQRCTNLISAHPVLTLILAGAFLLRLPWLSESLWYDETWSTLVKLRTFADLVSLARYDIHPPLYSALMFIWIRIFGDSEVSIRTPPLIFALVAIVVAYHLARRLVGVRAAGLVVLLLVLSPVHVWYSHEARHYALTLLLVLSVALLTEVAEEDDRWVPAHFTLGVLAILTHYYAAVFVAISGLVTVLRYSTGWRRPIVRSSIAALVVGAAFLGLRHLDAGIQTGEGHLRQLTLAEAWRLLFSWFPTGYALWSSSGWAEPVALALQLAIAAVFLVGFVSLLRRRRGDAVVVALYLFGPVAVLMLAGAVGFRRTYIERSLLPLLPFFLMLLAVGLTRIPLQHRQLVLPAVVAVCAIAVFVASCLKPDEWTVYKPKPDWRGATRYLSTEASKSGTGLVVFAGTPITAVLYYDGSFEEHRRLFEKDRHDALTSAAEPVSVLPTRSRLRRWILDENPPRAGRRNRIYVVNLLNTHEIWERVTERGVGTFYVVREGYPRTIDGVRTVNNVQARFASDLRFEHIEDRVFKAVYIRKWAVRLRPNTGEPGA